MDQAKVSEKDKLRELIALDEKATQGEWAQFGDGSVRKPGGVFADEEDAEFIAALVNFWRSGGRELAENFDWLTKAEYVEVQIDGKLFRVDGGRLGAVIDVARKEIEK